MDRKLRKWLEQFPAVRDTCHSATGVVPGPGTKPLEITIPNAVHFVSESITGIYTTLDAGGADGGVCLLDLKINLRGKYELFYNDVPLSCFMSPGRQRTSGIAGDPSHQLFYPKKFENMFPALSQIKLDFSSSAATDNEVTICLWGTDYMVDAIPKELQKNLEQRR